MSYVPIRVSTLRGDQKVGFEIFLPLGSKHILYIRKGDSFEGDRIQKLKEKKLRKLYIRPEDEENYRTYLDQNLTMAFDPKSNKSIEQRSEIVQGASQGAVEEAMETPEKKENYDYAKNMATRFVQFLIHENEAFKNILNIKNHDQNLAHHGVSVATLFVALAQKLGVPIDAKFELTTLGVFLHDYGHSDSSVNLRQKPESMSEAERKIYLQHPHLGVEKVREIKHFDQIVLDVIRQHHERFDGSGFPDQLSKSRVDELILLAGLCDLYDRLITYEGLNPKDVPKFITVEHMGRFPLEWIKALSAVAGNI